MVWVLIRFVRGESREVKRRNPDLLRSATWDGVAWCACMHLPLLKSRAFHRMSLETDAAYAALAKGMCCAIWPKILCDWAAYTHTRSGLYVSMYL